MPASSVNDSGSGGYLAPTSVGTPTPDDLGLDTLLGRLIAGITGLDGSTVLPRWQETQPRIPPVGTNWCAVGVAVTFPDGQPARLHHSEGQGFTVLRAFYQLDVLASFYGPDSDGLARLAHDGLHIAQNREAMVVSGLAFVSTDPIRRLPEIVATGSRRRSDLPFRLNQVVERRYEIRNVQSLAGQILAQGGHDDGPAVLTDGLSTTPPTGA